MLVVIGLLAQARASTRPYVFIPTSGLRFIDWGCEGLAIEADYIYILGVGLAFSSGCFFYVYLLGDLLRRLRVVLPGMGKAHPSASPSCLRPGPRTLGPQVTCLAHTPQAADTLVARLAHTHQSTDTLVAHTPPLVESQIPQAAHIARTADIDVLAAYLAHDPLTACFLPGKRHGHSDYQAPDYTSPFFHPFCFLNDFCLRKHVPDILNFCTEREKGLFPESPGRAASPSVPWLLTSPGSLF